MWTMYTISSRTMCGLIPRRRRATTDELQRPRRRAAAANTNAPRRRATANQRPRRRAADERYHPRRARRRVGDPLPPSTSVERTGVPRRRRAADELQRPLSTAFQAERKPLRSGPKGLRMGPVPVPETRYQCRSRGCQDDTGPETSFGRGELTHRCRGRSPQREGHPTEGLSHRRSSP